MGSQMNEALDAATVAESLGTTIRGLRRKEGLTLQELAEMSGKEALRIYTKDDPKAGTYNCDWVLVTSNREVLQSEWLKKASMRSRFS